MRRKILTISHTLGPGKGKKHGKEGEKIGQTPNKVRPLANTRVPNPSRKTTTHNTTGSKECKGKEREEEVQYTHIHTLYIYTFPVNETVSVVGSE